MKHAHTAVWALVTGINVTLTGCRSPAGSSPAEGTTATVASASATGSLSSAPSTTTAEPPPPSPPRPEYGPWGEELGFAPSFALEEERRAPKVPAGDRIFRETQGAHRYAGVSGALLVCHLQVGAPKSKFDRVLMDIMTMGLAELSNANIVLHLAVRDEPTIALQGAFKHDACFVSIPALTLAAGDRLEMTLFDRTTFTDSKKSLGSSERTWDGASPLRFRTDRWKADCTLLDGPEARRRAVPWLTALDRLIARIVTARPDPKRRDLGRPSDAVAQLETNYFGGLELGGNFRYTAGFLGWKAPEIQSRLAAYRKGIADFDEAAKGEVLRLVRESGDEIHLGTPGWTARLASTPDGNEMTVSAAAPLECGRVSKAMAALFLVDEDGHFAELGPEGFTLVDATGAPCGAHANGGARSARGAPPLRALLAGVRPSHRLLTNLREYARLPAITP